MANNYEEYTGKIAYDTNAHKADQVRYVLSGRGYINNPIEKYLDKVVRKRQLELATDIFHKHLRDCKVIYNPPATVVIWSDDVKTVVKTTDGEEFDPERGFLQAFYERFNGLTKTQGNKLLKDLRKQYEGEDNDLD